MKILIVGDWHSELHEQAVYNACVALGYKTYRFSWCYYFRSESNLGLYLKKAQNKFIYGPIIIQINKDFKEKVDSLKPELIFIYRGTHISAESLAYVKSKHPETVIAAYNNDDPFSSGHPVWLWRLFLKAVPVYDIIFAYRHHNFDDFKRLGAKRIELLRSWYIPEKNFPAELTDEDRKLYDSEVVFVGHLELDGRVQALEKISMEGISLRIFGPAHEWNPVLKYSRYLSHLVPVKAVWGNDYNKALCGAKIALCFLSKLNRDTYTRRCFEIPATRTFLLSEYTGDLAQLYEEGREAEYFRSHGELLEKLKKYLNNEEKRIKVANAGYIRLRLDEHDVVSRVKNALSLCDEVRGELISAR